MPLNDTLILTHSLVARDSETLVVLFHNASGQEEVKIRLELRGIESNTLHSRLRRVDCLTVQKSLIKAELVECSKHVAHQPEVGRRSNTRGFDDLFGDLDRLRAVFIGLR